MKVIRFSVRVVDTMNINSDEIVGEQWIISEAKDISRLGPLLLSSSYYLYTG